MSMRVRRFTGREMDEVLTQVKEELGEEAIIISTREVEKEVIEVCAGLGTPYDDMSHFQATPLPQEKGPVILLDRIIQQPELQFAGQESVEGIFSSQGLDANLAQRLIDNIDPKHAANAAPLDKLIGDSLQNILHFDPSLPAAQRVVALLGAPGVGKTTTIAKLAARLQEAFGLRIGLIAADSFKVGAGFHLQTYASLMNLPFKLLNPTRPFVEELRKALRAFEALDLILVDTPGCGARETERLGDLAQNLSTFTEMERLLVVPAPSNDIDLFASARAFEACRYTRMILSKVDESAYIGPAINTAMKCAKSFAFFTTGQRVPEDIEPASARRLGWMLTRTIH